jgi:hypothetical protein
MGKLVDFFNGCRTPNADGTDLRGGYACLSRDRQGYKAGNSGSEQ